MNHEDLTNAVRASLLADDARETRHNVHRLRARRDETAARLALYPVTGRVSNVVPLRQPRDPDGPAAA